MTYENGEYVAFTPKDHTHPEKEDQKDISYRRFNVTLQPIQLYEAVKKSIRNDEVDNERLLTLCRVILDKLNENDEYNNVLVWHHIKARTERYFVKHRKVKNRVGRPSNK